MELFDKLGVDWRLLIAQIINFLILLAILYKFVYRKLLSTLEDRRLKIEKGVEDAKKAGAELKSIVEEKEKTLIIAKQEAQKILDETKKIAESEKQKIIIEAKKEKEKIIKETQEELIKEKGKMIELAKDELGELVILATKKTLEKIIDDKKDKQIIEETVKKLKL